MYFPAASHFYKPSINFHEVRPNAQRQRKFAIAVSGFMHTLSIPKDHRTHLNYDQFFISSRNDSMSYDINRDKRKCQLGQKGVHKIGLYPLRKFHKPDLLPSVGTSVVLK